MGVLLQEVLESAGYKLTEKDDAIWLLSKRNEFEELVESAQRLIDTEEERQSDIAEAEYKERFGDE